MSPHNWAAPHNWQRLSGALTGLPVYWDLMSWTNVGEFSGLVSISKWHKISLSLEILCASSLRSSLLEEQNIAWNFRWACAPWLRFAFHPPLSGQQLLLRRKNPVHWNSSVETVDIADSIGLLLFQCHLSWLRGACSLRFKRRGFNEMHSFGGSFQHSTPLNQRCWNLPLDIVSQKERRALVDSRWR